MCDIIIYGFACPTTKELKYIGKTINLKDRIRRHKNDSKHSRRTSKFNSWLKSILSKGLEPDVFIVDVVEEDNWEFWEDFYIQYYKSIGCNLKNTQPGGIHPKRTPLREETKLKISKALTGKKRIVKWKVSEEGRKNIRNAIIGRRHSEESKRKMSINNTRPGLKLTNEQLLEIRDLLSKGLSQYKIAEIFKVDQSTISDIKTGKRKEWQK